jgi:hypothetical protein
MTGRIVQVCNHDFRDMPGFPRYGHLLLEHIRYLSYNHAMAKEKQNYHFWPKLCTKLIFPRLAQWQYTTNSMLSRDRDHKVSTNK